MKILKILILPMIIIITILILNITKDNKIYYLSLGDELSKGINSNGYEDIGYSDLIKEKLKIKKYTKEFSDTNIRIIDLINKIENNEEKNISIQYALKKSNLITISIGLNEIYNNYMINNNESDIYNYIDEIICNIDYLFSLINKFNNKKIYILGYYNPINDIKLDKYIKYANNKLINISNNHNIKYIDLYNIFKNNTHLIYNSIYPNKDGYQLIANEILKNM
ncbi:MAG: hypothetical protein IJK66_05535 [Bacilli bacterium]|nr:hypothetical protein [Bacilli bacterium]